MVLSLALIGHEIGQWAERGVLAMRISFSRRLMSTIRNILGVLPIRSLSPSKAEGDSNVAANWTSYSRSRRLAART